MSIMLWNVCVLSRLNYNQLTLEVICKVLVYFEIRKKYVHKIQDEIQVSIALAQVFKAY